MRKPPLCSRTSVLRLSTIPTLTPLASPGGALGRKNVNILSRVESLVATSSGTPAGETLVHFSTRGKKLYVRLEVT